MAGSKHVVVWPHVKVFVDGKSKVLDKGDLVPDGVGPVVRDQLVSFGAIAGVTEVPEPSTDGGDADGSGEGQGGEFDPEVGGNIKPTLAWVGDDKARAQQMLDLEASRDEKDRRPSLVEKLTAVAQG